MGTQRIPDPANTMNTFTDTHRTCIDIINAVLSLGGITEIRDIDLDEDEIATVHAFRGDEPIEVVATYDFEDFDAEVLKCFEMRTEQPKPIINTNVFEDGTKFFKNFYECPDCGERWEDIWSSKCDDCCGVCNCNDIEPYESQDCDPPEWDSRLQPASRPLKTGLE